MDIRRSILLTAFLSAALCSAQSMRPEDLAPGKILVAPRESPDPHFANSVVVLARYDRTGALGLMIHYLSGMTIGRALAGVTGAEKRNDPLYVGGPVDLPLVLALLRSPTAPNAATPKDATHITGNLFLLPSKQSIGAAFAQGRKASDLRVFLGYAGWGPGQLEHEVRLHGWHIFNYEENLVFDEHPETLWERLIRKTEQKVALSGHLQVKSGG